MIPLKDDNPRSRFPIVNTLIIALNVVVFFHQMFLPEPEGHEFVFAYGAVPQSILAGTQLHTLFTSMFLHGGLMHIAGNMLYLFIFGDNIENLTGHLRYVFFYILCGLAAAFTHIFTSTDPISMQTPMIGASGAISGVLGAYAISYPHARVLVLVPIFFYITTFWIRAFFMLGFWFLTQLVSAATTIGVDVGGGIAWFAHIGGFVVGAILVKFFQQRKRRYRAEVF